MSTAPLARDEDVRRLLDDGYDVTITGGHLVVRRIPYATADKTVAYGQVAYPVTVSGDRVVSSTDHRIWFVGRAPCNEHGQQLSCANPETHAVDAETAASFMLSSKPASGAYPSQYEKVTAYVRIVSHPAMALDPTVTATPGAAFQDVEDDLPFNYRDTATSRAGLARLNSVFTGQHLTIVGLGGTGGYVLDQVAKTPVTSILLIDGDVFDNHNAFRAPGAPTLEQLQQRPYKVNYFADMYGNMHTGITAEPVHITDENLSLLDDATFVFLCMDDATVKHQIAAHLLAQHIPFIDVGMGVEEIDGKLSGLLRVTFADVDADTTSTLGRLPAPAEERDDYDRNIQVADLNALNAQFAVGRWKRHLGFYADATAEHLATYSIFTNDIVNERLDGEDDEQAAAS
ncbi:ThiF family adenylyltransferase [Nocardioides halotolerans]|uniref:ThiF family adenylyltransferase n=1 Tax=Nocardioides halotolerans TaxID=433660 RepID=UPI00040FA2A0|nr:ThiF family adenylyltransferase [Nocardioides halotolerans]